MLEIKKLCLISMTLKEKDGVKVKVLVIQLCSTLCNPMDCSLPGSTIHGISQERILEWVAISFSRGSSQELNLCLLHCRWTLYHLATRETPTVTPYSVKAGNSIES